MWADGRVSSELAYEDDITYSEFALLNLLELVGGFIPQLCCSLD